MESLLTQMEQNISSVKFKDTLAIPLQEKLLAKTFIMCLQVSSEKHCDLPLDTLKMGF